MATARFGLQAPSGKLFRQRIGYRQHQIMELINSSPVTFMALLEHLGDVDRGNLSRSIANLEQRGLISRITYGRSRLLVRTTTDDASEAMPLRQHGRGV